MLISQRGRRFFYVKVRIGHCRSSATSFVREVKQFKQLLVTWLGKHLLSLQSNITNNSFLVGFNTRKLCLPDVATKT